MEYEKTASAHDEDARRANEARQIILEARKHHTVNAYLRNLLLWGALGPLSAGYSIAIIASSLGQPSFALYFDFAGTSNLTIMLGSVGAAAFFGGLLASCSIWFVADRWGRKMAFLVAGIASIIGQALTGGSTNSWAMLIVARLITGYGGWSYIIIGTVYTSETAVPETRGFLSGAVGGAFAVAFGTAAWAGYGFFFWTGTAAWRVAALIGLVFPILHLAGLNFVPESPRWLSLNGREQEAREILVKMHRNADDPADLYALVEFKQVMAQAQLDKTLDSSWMGMFTIKANRKRAILAFGLDSIVQWQGVASVTLFAPTLFASLGYNAQDSLLLAAGYTTLAPIFGIFQMFVLDSFGRKPLVLIAMFGSVVNLSIIAALKAIYGDTDNKAGLKTIVAFIYIFYAVYMLSESPEFVVVAEIFPTHLRMKGVCLGIAAFCLNDIWINYSAPYGIANLGYKYYLIYICLSFVGGIYLLITMPETKMIPLEQMALLFGDEQNLAVKEEDVLNEIAKELEQ